MKINDCNLDDYSALLFDLDGTLINSMPLHNKAWMDTFKANGVSITKEFLQETAGTKSARIVEIVNERHGLTLDPTNVARQKRNQYLSTLHEVEVVAPLLEIIKKYYDVKPMAIITASSHEVVDQLLPKLGIDHFFQTIICAEDTLLGKDTIEPYTLASKQLDTNPKECLFFDDGDVGLKGAKLAGMDVIHVDITSPEIFTPLL